MFFQNQALEIFFQNLSGFLTTKWNLVIGISIGLKCKLFISICLIWAWYLYHIDNLLYCYDICLYLLLLVSVWFDSWTICWYWYRFNINSGRKYRYWYWLAVYLYDYIGIDTSGISPPHYDKFGRANGVISKIVLGFRNLAWGPK